MRIARFLALIVIICLSLLSMPIAVGAFPPLPSSVYGTVKLNGTNVPNGTPVQAIINEKIVASSLTETYEGNSVYSLDVPGDDPASTSVEGGREGDTIYFKLGGIQAAQTGTWHSATNVNLNLTATSANTPLPTQPTLTPLPTQTKIKVIPTQIPPTNTLQVIILPSVTNTRDTNTPYSTIQEGENTSTIDPMLSETSESEGRPVTSLDTRANTSLIWIFIPVVFMIICLLFLTWFIKYKK